MVSKTSDPVGSVMRSAVWGFEDEFATSIAEKMIENDIGAIVVTSQGVPAGMITEKDIVEKIVKDGKNPARVRAREIMSSPIVSIESDKSIEAALKMMREKNIRRLTIVDREAPANLGIVTIRRILDALIET
jgi:CBS domain-containing protein